MKVQLLPDAPIKIANVYRCSSHLLHPQDSLSYSFTVRFLSAFSPFELLGFIPDKTDRRGLCYSVPRQFVDRRHYRFLGQLPTDWPYGVEIRNKNFLHAEYFAALKEHNVTHVFNDGLACHGAQ